MNPQIRQVAFAAILATVPSLVSAQEIGGAFGKNLGGKFTPDNATSTSETTSGEPLYGFQPQNPYPALHRYYVLLTPSSNRIYAIWAVGQFDDNDACTRELEKVERILAKRYPDAEKSEPIVMGTARHFQQRDRAIAVRCNIGFPESQLYVQYLDIKLAEQAKDEAAEQAIEGGETGGF